VLAIVAPAFAGDAITEDFNAGVFTAATTGRAVNLNGNYDWAGAGDSLDGWSALIDTSGGVQPGGEIYLQTGFGSFGPQGTNNSWAGHFGAGTADGNVGGYYAKQNDVPKSGWEYSTTLTAAMGGGRNANGDALAFVMLYDAELSWIHPSRGAIGRVNGYLILDGVQTRKDSPAFYRTTNEVNGLDYVWNSEYVPGTAGQGDVVVDALPSGVLLDTSDAGADAAIRGVSTGVVEQVVADGATITARFLHNRVRGRTATGPAGGSNWQYMGIAADNVRVVVLEAGDANGDLGVDGSDLNIWNENKFTGGTSWVTADWNGDGNTDGSDLNGWNTNKFTSYDLLPPEVTDVADVVYDPTTGELKLVVLQNQVEAALLITTADTNIVSTSPENLPFYNGILQAWTHTYFGGKMQFTDGTLGLGGAPATVGEYVIAQLATGLTDADFGEVEYGSSAGTQFTTVTVIPEPASLALLGLGGLLVLRRRAA
jgi:hypothetical protein